MPSGVGTVAERLNEAERALHDLNVGEATVRIRSQAGELIEYRPADRGALQQYIADLKRQQGGSGITGPMQVFF